MFAIVGESFFRYTEAVVLPRIGASLSELGEDPRHGPLARPILVAGRPPEKPARGGVAPDIPIS